MNQTKKLSDYLHFYIGGKVRHVHTGETFVLTADVYNEIINGRLEALPILYDWNTVDRSFFDTYKKLTEGYLKGEMANYSLTFKEVVFFMLQQQFDYFELFNEGLAFLDISSEFAKRVYVGAGDIDVLHISSEYFATL